MKPRAKVPAHKRMKPSGKSPGYLDLIRQLPCILSGRPSEAAHVRYADPSHGKDITGMGRKPDDCWTLPLCPELHRLLDGCQHDSDERKWWKQFGFDPLHVCKLLWANRDGRQKMERIVSHFQPVKPEIKAIVASILKGKTNGKSKP